MCVMVPFTVQVCYFFWLPGRYSAPMWAAQPGIGWVLPNQGSDRWPLRGSGHPEPLDSQGKGPLAFFPLFFFLFLFPGFFRHLTGCSRLSVSEGSFLCGTQASAHKCRRVKWA